VLTPDWYARDERLPLLWVESIDPDSRVATLSLGEPPPNLSPGDRADLIARFERLVVKKVAAASRLVLWDHQGGDYWGLPVSPDVWHPSVQGKSTHYPGIVLENGIRALVDAGKFYRASDYWQFTARTSDVVAADGEDPAFESPSGPEHVYAPLAVISIDAGGLIQAVDLRKQFKPLGI
jgi:hypothetical protein